MALPTTSDVTPFLGGASVPASFSVQNALDDALDEWQGRTSRVFLADTGDTTTYYNPPDGRSGKFILQLDDFYTITSVTVNISPTYAGDAVTLNTDFFVLPATRRSGWPIEGLQFIGKIYRMDPLSVKIIGKKGSFVDCPAKAFRAICMRAAADVIDAASAYQGAVSGMKQGEREVRYQAPEKNEVSALAARYRAEFNGAVSYYLRVPLL